MKSPTDVVDDWLGEVGREIDAADLGADGGAQAFDAKVVPCQLGEASPLVGKMQNRSDTFASQGLTILGDVGAWIFGGNDVCVSGVRLHVPPCSWFLTGHQKP